MPLACVAALGVWFALDSSLGQGRFVVVLLSGVLLLVGVAPPLTASAWAVGTRVTVRRYHSVTADVSRLRKASLEGDSHDGVLLGVSDGGPTLRLMVLRVSDGWAGTSLPVHVLRAFADLMDTAADRSVRTVAAELRVQAEHLQSGGLPVHSPLAARAGTGERVGCSDAGLSDLFGLFDD